MNQTDNTPALEIKNLSKQFVSAEGTPILALDDVSLTIPRGGVCGLLGHNGAGKTTLLRIVNNILTADSGSVSILGQPVSMEKTSPLVGYMPEERGLYDRMKVEEQIMYFGLLKGGEPRRLREVMNEYIDIFRLSGDRNRKIKELSKGNQQKVQIIATLVHEPQVVMLDEPFSGFDPINGLLLRELIERLHSNGVTLILSSHNMESIEKMCDRIALINRGRIMLDGNLAIIKENHRDGTLLLSTRSPLHIPVLMDCGVVDDIHPMDENNRHGCSTYQVRTKQGVSNGQFLNAVTQQADIVHFEEKLPTLSDIFISYTGK